jgi:hypothetical protein
MKDAGLRGISRDTAFERSEAGQVVATLELSYRGAVRATAACPRRRESHPGVIPFGWCHPPGLVGWCGGRRRDGVGGPRGPHRLHALLLVARRTVAWRVSRLRPCLEARGPAAFAGLPVVVTLKRALRSDLVLFVLAMVAVVVLAVVLANLPTRDTWYGDILPWVGPLAAVLAVIAASVASVFAVAAYRREVRRDEAREQVERSAQASLVAAWPVLFNFDGSRETGSSGYAIRNASELPIRDVRITRLGGDEDFDPVATHLDLLLVPPSVDPLWIRDGQPYTLLPGEVAVHGAELPSSDGWSISLRLEFRDSADTLWARDREGRLQQMS